MALDDRSGRIDHTAPRHLWEQVADDIRADIAAGRLAEGDRLPSEFELAEQYGVSRVTIRRVVGVLTAEGLITVLRGRGTYVN